MSTTATLRAELDAMRAAIARMGEIIVAGEWVDLTSLEESVAELCKRLNAAPAATTRDMRSSLIALIDDLSRLDTLMRQTQGEIAQQLGETTQRRRATIAYGSAPVRK